MPQTLQNHKMHRIRELSDQGHPRSNILAKSELMDNELRPSRQGKREKRLIHNKTNFDGTGKKLVKKTEMSNDDG